jgi:hypothetical protein
MKPLLRRSLKVLAGGLVLLVLFHLVENWRGRRAWAAWQQEQKASGQRFDLVAFVPPPVPDAENFALVPRIADSINGKQPLLELPGGWPSGTMNGWHEGQHVDLDAYAKVFPEGDVRKGLEAYRGVLDDFVQATRKPACRIPIDYNRYPGIEIPSLLGFRGAARMLQLRAIVELRDGHSNAAFEDVSALLRAIHHFDKEPILLCQLLRLAMTGIALQPVWEGMEAHAWTDGQLAALQQDLASIDLLTSFARSWGFEQSGTSALYLQVAQEWPWQWTFYPRAYFDSGKPSRLGSFMRHLLIPRGWVLQNAVRSSRAVRKVVIDPMDPTHHRLDPRRQDEALERSMPRSRTPYTFLAEGLPVALAAQNVRVARFQAGLDQAAIACELERRNRTKGAYPDRLKDLGNTIPGDVIGGGPMHYRRTDDGGYVLYSLGWNDIDDGGQPGRGDDAIKKGDWVWEIRGKHD